MNKILKLGAGALIAGAVITAAGCSTSGAPTNTADAASHAHQNAEDKMPRINVQEARKLAEEGKALIIDVRGEDAYKMSHIKGAANVPLNKLEAGDFKDLPKDKLIVAYCG